MRTKKYGRAFYDHLHATVQSSAHAVVPLLIELFHPHSVVDFGCGPGTWLSEFKNSGVKTVLGLDGDWVSEDQLVIDRREFLRCNLGDAPLLDRRFDLAVSLEVGEHLPPEGAARFVEAIAASSDIVVFSAAIPFQGGTTHLNEQWPEYWANLFYDRAFQALDILRPRLWNNPYLEPYYAQNIFVFAATDRAAEFEKFKSQPAEGFTDSLTRIHPRVWESKMVEAQDLTRFGTGTLLRALPRSVARSIRMRLGAE